MLRATAYVGVRTVSSHGSSSDEADGKLRMPLGNWRTTSQRSNQNAAVPPAELLPLHGHVFRFSSEFLILNISRSRQYKACAPLKVALLVEQAIRDVLNLGAFLFRPLNAALKECTTGRLHAMVCRTKRLLPFPTYIHDPSRCFSILDVSLCYIPISLFKTSLV